MFSKVTKSGEFKANKKDENENIQYYAGSENQLAMTRCLMSLMLVMINGELWRRKKQWIVVNHWNTDSATTLIEFESICVFKVSLNQSISFLKVRLIDSQVL